MRVCYFGSYDAEYARNAIIRRGLAMAGVEIHECRVDIGISSRQSYRELWQLQKKLPGSIDAIVVAEINQYQMPLARCVARRIGARLVFDPFISLYDTRVQDRALVSPYSFKAGGYRVADWAAVNLADAVFSDTEAHLTFFRQFVGLRRPGFVVPIGANEAVFDALRFDSVHDDSGEFRVLFWGKFIPLQGVDTILRAAKLLEREAGLSITLIGSGQMLSSAKDLALGLELANVQFPGFVPLAELPKHIALADVCLGIFGTTEKALRVVPNKVYEGLAMRKPVITGASPAIEEEFEPGRHILTVPMGSAEAVAEAVMRLRRDIRLSRRLAACGYEIYRASFTSAQIGRRARDALERVIASPIQ